MKFNDKLVLNKYILSLLGMESFEELAKEFDGLKLQGVDENNHSYYYNVLVNNITAHTKKISSDKLAEYDENIVRYTKQMGRDIEWKYFQYLSLLFVEIYLDQFFDDSETLLEELNTQVEILNDAIVEFNKGKKAKDKAKVIEKYIKSDLNKIALYNATGSGKTLLMHINLMQFNHYAKGKLTINKTVLITPNVGLSNQHLEEFSESNIEAEIFSKESKGLFESSAVEIIEITKLGDEEGDKTVAVDSFEDNNLVFIDEGHRGSSGDIWKTNRDKLSANGFAFEYSATFAQAINSGSGAKKDALENEYVKSIIFDYSYKYFYNDGYGKDYSILNDSEEIKQTYLTASLLSFYQQMKIYKNSKSVLKPYLIAKPLMVFVGSSVNAVRTESKKQVSDVVDILLFINDFIKNQSESISNIDRIMSLDSGLQTSAGVDVFDNKFAFLSKLKLDAPQIFQDMLAVIFNATSGVLHIENLKGVDGEIGLKIGENEYFGIINVGDSDKLTKMCETNGITVTSRDFANSLFNIINRDDSTLNLLIGSKKFSEGWSSWRVSTMGLMNVGKSEGSQIIQLFGRGVRLKGYNFCLKRSRAIAGKELDRELQAIETLNIFGLKADYMKAFKEYLKNEGVPTDERVEFVLPVIYDKRFKKKKLKVLDLQEGKDFKKEVRLDFEYCDISTITKKVNLSLYKPVDILESQKKSGNQLERNREILKKEHLSFLNLDTLFFALQQYKNENHWNNLNITKDCITTLIQENNWYTLEVPKTQFKIKNFGDLKKFENIATTLLKKYMKAFYEYHKSEWDSQFLEYREIDDVQDKANLITEYTLTIEDKETELIERVKELQVLLEAETLDTVAFKRISKRDFSAFAFNNHLYNPLLFKEKGVTTLKISPVNLNEGEMAFVEDLDKYLKDGESRYKDSEIFLLRNQSKTGLGFFTEGNFYPDFIMWIIQGEKQFITFIDPKGIRNLNPRTDPKMELAITIRDIQKRLNDNNTILNSFIISNTTLQSLNTLHSDLSYQEFEEKNVLFQENENYINTMMTIITN